MKQQKFKLSFCTTCMGRLYHLKETLRRNIEDNLAYGNVEFVLLDYNSRDDLENWVRCEMMEYVKSGTLVYLKTDEPDYWNVSHAKNIVSLHASGDIIYNVDADQFTPVGSAHYINQCFNADASIFLTGRTTGATWDVMGRACFWKSDFIAINGYDERISGYGYDDKDIYNRLVRLGRKEVNINLQLMRSIQHSNHDRMMNTRYIKDIDFILLNESSDDIGVLVMKSDHQFEHFMAVRRPEDKGTVLSQDCLETGTWYQDDDEFVLQHSNAVLRVCKGEAPHSYIFKNTIYQKVMHDEMMDIYFQYALVVNQKVYYQNIAEEGSCTVNKNGFGKAIIHRNFVEVE